MPPHNIERPNPSWVSREPRSRHPGGRTPKHLMRGFAACDPRPRVTTSGRPRLRVPEKTVKVLTRSGVLKDGARWCSDCEGWIG